MFYERRFRRDSYDSIDRSIDTEYVNLALQVFDMCNDKERAETILSELIYLIERDKTGVLNYRGFHERISSNHIRNGNIIFFDLNNLKIINDTLGHRFGDDYINTFINLMRAESINLKITFARVGGDEFVAYSPSSTSSIDEVMVSINRELKSHNIYYRVSYGISKLDGSKTLQEAISEADSIMYDDKKKSKGLIL